MTSVSRSRWTVRALGGVALASLLSSAAIATDPHRPEQARTSRSTDRGMFVSVLNKDGAPVTDLTPAEFVVREDGVAREVLRAERATEPITLTVLVDTSQAARPYIADMRRALQAFVKRMAGKNPMAITVFGERPSVITDYTLDVPALERGIDRIFSTSGSGSYLLQGVEEIYTSLAKRDFDRAVILAITAGGPEFSDRNYEEFVSKLRDSGATFDAMVFTLEPPNLADFGQRNREMFLDAATRATGGDRFSLLSSMALDGALARLADELTSQYRITYGRPESLIPPEKIEVSVRRPGLTARGTPIAVRQR
ncbi:MAG TPA: VWA domain-containing protein [Vicinamibacterales bacterium]